MAYPSVCTNRWAQRVVLLLLALLILVVCILERESSREEEVSSNRTPSCPCHCDCFQDLVLRYPSGQTNSSFEDCGANDPELKEEMKKDISDLLLDELALLKDVASDTLERTKAAIRETGEGMDRFKREEEKCGGRVDTCEVWRERAEADIVDEVKLTELWEKRARELGWRDFPDHR